MTGAEQATTAASNVTENPQAHKPHDPHDRSTWRRRMDGAMIVRAKAEIVAAIPECETLSAALRLATARLGLSGQPLDGGQVNHWRRRDHAFGTAIEAAIQARDAATEKRRLLARRRERRLARLLGESSLCERWRADEDAILVVCAGRLSSAEIAARLNSDVWADERVRNGKSVKQRAARLGVSVYVHQSFTLRALMGLFGAHRLSVRTLIDGGLLAARVTPSGHGDSARVERAAVERFIRQSPWAYNPDAMRGDRRLVELARTLHAADPWWTSTQAADYLGVSCGQVNRLARGGVLPGRRRILGSNGPPRVFRRRDVVAFASNQLRKGA